MPDSEVLCPTNPRLQPESTFLVPSILHCQWCEAWLTRLFMSAEWLLDAAILLNQLPFWILLSSTSIRIHTTWEFLVVKQSVVLRITKSASPSHGIHPRIFCSLSFRIRFDAVLIERWLLWLTKEIYVCIYIKGVYRWKGNLFQFLLLCAFGSCPCQELSI